MTTEQILMSIEFLSNNKCSTTLTAISRDTGIPVATLTQKLAKLVKKDVLYKIHNNYFVGAAGCDILEAADERIYDESSLGFHDWSNEVLTGMTENGRQSEIVNPALPKMCHDTENDIEDTFVDHFEARNGKQAKLVAQIIENHPWLPVDQLAVYWHSGLIVVCRSCGLLAVHKKKKSNKRGVEGRCINCQRIGKE